MDAALANQLVAGIPAAARAVHYVASLASRSDQSVQCQVAVPGGWTPSDQCRAEIARLAPDVGFSVIDTRTSDHAPGVNHLSGEALITDPAGVEDSFDAMLERRVMATPPTLTERSKDDVANLSAALTQAGNRIVKNTGKPGDGIVSRTINRPISQAITRLLLPVRGIKPLHATIMAAVLGIAMALFLFAGGPAGLIVGALLFQAASITDGVDGEIARATFRSSPAGATLDSTIDAITNLAFIAGLSFNVYLQGEKLASAAGAIGLALMALGLFLIGRRARRNGGSLSFDVVKDHLRDKKSTLMQWLTWLTMRDFYAAAAASLVIVGLASEMLFIFAFVTAGWLVVTLSVLLKPARSSM